MLADNDKSEILDDISYLMDLLEVNDMSTSVATLIKAAANIERREMLPNNEETEGVVLVTIGKENHNMVFEGEFVSSIAYGALVDSILKIHMIAQQQEFAAPIKSMVAEALKEGEALIAKAAQAEKEVTNPTDH